MTAARLVDSKGLHLENSQLAVLITYQPNYAFIRDYGIAARRRRKHDFEFEAFAIRRKLTLLQHNVSAYRIKERWILQHLHHL